MIRGADHGAGLQQLVSAASRALHLLLLGEPRAEHRVHRALDEGGRDPLLPSGTARRR
jgi:hypothetical protein